MSEDLTQSSSKSLSRYDYLRLGTTTLNQLKKSNYIKCQIPEASKLRKPDGILFLPKGGIKAVIEIKPQNKDIINNAQSIIEEYAPIAKAVCNLLIITDGANSLWVNPHTEKEVVYKNQPLREKFPIKEIENGTIGKKDAQYLVEYVEECDFSLNARNNELKEAKTLNPQALSEKIWQKIWINTGKEPEKCLYNVVELFVFKFLSDIGVLEGSYSFKHVIKTSLAEGSDVALETYAKMSRDRIVKLFPNGSDGTTIINGTIFVNEIGDPNLQNSPLFLEIMEDFQDFENKEGSFKNIDREFKTRLYEVFLRQTASVKSMGQYFTPRNIVRAMVEMAEAHRLPQNAKISDPFCGVGGFILETIIENKNIYNQFQPDEKGKIKPEVTIKGFDKGTDEKDDERTVILAKANMLIYFSDLLSKFNSESYLEEFSNKAFNSVFELIRDNLGTFTKSGEEKYDLILTNPPYVTSGSRTLKREIESRGLDDKYSPIGRGTESLAVQWVIENLSPAGKAFVIVPDGLLIQEKLLQYIKRKTFIEAIVSLPSRAFFSTPKKTYILSLRRKEDDEIQQDHPVFTYLVSEVGESRDSRRLPIKENHLENMVDEFKYFSANKNRRQSKDTRCKIVNWDDFSKRPNWLVDKLWSHEEKEELGIKEEKIEIGEDEFIELVQTTIGELQNQLNIIESLNEKY